MEEIGREWTKIQPGDGIGFAARLNDGQIYIVGLRIEEALLQPMESVGLSDLAFQRDLEGDETRTFRVQWVGQFFSRHSGDSLRKAVRSETMSLLSQRELETMAKVGDIVMVSRDQLEESRGVALGYVLTDAGELLEIFGPTPYSHALRLSPVSQQEADQVI